MPTDTDKYNYYLQDFMHQVNNGNISRDSQPLTFYEMFGYYQGKPMTLQEKIKRRLKKRR